jgi:thiol-disulfide isomerase/thioredoxin
MSLRWICPFLSLLLVSVVAIAEDSATPDPYWSLIHDSAVLEDLKLTSEQRKRIRAVLDPLDIQCFPLRNKPAAEATKGFAAATAEARQEIAKILKPQQNQRLAQIVVRSQGPSALLRDDVAKKLSLTETQQTTIREATASTQEAKTELQSNLRASKTDAAAAEKEWTAINNRERDAVNTALTDDQKQKLIPLIARDFDVSRLGKTAFKTPDLVGDSASWLNSSPLSAEQLRGQVVVVHFFAFGCINCIHNYPTYREWQREFAGRDVHFIGIHTPETKAEHNVETLKAKLKAEELQFPVLVDNELANWNAFGNSMWPSVYCLDKQGYMRSFWAGELRWQGATGDQQMKQTIEALLAEK